MAWKSAISRSSRPRILMPSGATKTRQQKRAVERTIISAAIQPPRSAPTSTASLRPNSLAGLSRDWGSCSAGCWRMRIVGGLEALPEAGAERAVVDGAADLEQQVGPAP